MLAGTGTASPAKCPMAPALYARKMPPIFCTWPG